MNVEAADFQARICTPSPAPYFQSMASFGIPTHPAQFKADTQYAQFPPASSSFESYDSLGSFYSKPHTSIESAGSRASWSSSDIDWAQRRVGIEDAHRNLQRENSELSKQIFIWKAKFETLQSAYNLLLERIPAASEAARKKLNPDDFPLIDYWFKHQWVSLSGDRVANISGKGENEDEDAVAEDAEDLRATSPVPGAQRGQSRSRAGINVSMRYIQDEDGKIIDGHRAREIRIHARALFVGFAMQGKQFASWGDADAISCRTFYTEMVNRFEELQYCDLDWKSEQIATDAFPGWKVTWLKKKTCDGAKRGRQQSIGQEPDLKRSKAAEATSTLLVSLHEAQEQASNSQVMQLPVPVVNIIPNTPTRKALTADLEFNMQGPEVQQSWDPSLLQPNQLRRDFPIINPLANSVNSFAIGITPHAGQLTPAISATGAVGSHLQQMLEINHPQVPPPPPKRLRPGTTKMRPSKTSTTPRNLCALEWAITNPKGTAEEFSAYYDGLSPETKENWEKLSAKARESGKSAS